MIELRNIHKHFGEVVAVDQLSFQAADGSITGLLGHNGAGKTTALRVLCGLIRPQRGQAFVDSLDVHANPIVVRRRLGVLPDSRGLYPRLSARENIAYFGRLHGMDNDALQSRINELIELLDLGAVADRRVHGFSQGERMKVAIARAIVHRPKNIVLDEPTNGLDVMSIRAMRRLIRQLRDEGHCLVFSSHIMQEVAALCDRIVVVSRGCTVAAGTPQELRERVGVDSLEEVFVQLSNDTQPPSLAENREEDS
jgi:sodium transport system ATP-binding protein